MYSAKQIKSRQPLSSSDEQTTQISKLPTGQWISLKQPTHPEHSHFTPTISPSRERQIEYLELDACIPIDVTTIAEERREDFLKKMAETIQNSISNFVDSIEPIN